MAERPVSKRLADAIASLDRETLERVARILIPTSAFLDQHEPRERELVGRFACSGRTFHIPPCGGYTGDGSCEEEASEPWCPIDGHDCANCEAVAELRAILDETGNVR